MFQPFDVFRITDGQPLWIESASALEEAHTQVRELAGRQPGDYLISPIAAGRKLW